MPGGEERRGGGRVRGMEDPAAEVTARRLPLQAIVERTQPGRKGSGGLGEEPVDGESDVGRACEELVERPTHERVRVEVHKRPPDPLP